MNKDKWLAILLPLNAVMAAFLNIVSFEANKQCGPLAMAIIANLKQVILLAVPLNGQAPGRQVILGTLLTVGGSLWYANARTQDEQAKRSRPVSVLPTHEAVEQK